jgi:hypothetical protein
MYLELPWFCGLGKICQVSSGMISMVYHFQFSYISILDQF